MCYICNCFAWTLDLFQRILTFFLSCWLACAVCFGLIIAVVAGIAYGYNYSLAEFLVLKRSDVNVYMRRGQFYEKPDLFFNQRRSGDDADDFIANLTDEYQQEVSPGDDSFVRRWEMDQDTRTYAKKLTKYSESKNKNADQSYRYLTEEDESDLVQWKTEQDVPKHSNEKNVPQDNIYYKDTTPPARVTMLPNSIIPTTVLQSGSSEIFMRKFSPITNVISQPSDKVQNYDENDSLRVLNDITYSNTKPPEEIERKTLAVSTNNRIQLEDSSTRRVLNMRLWDTSPKPGLKDYPVDAVNEGSQYIVHKAM